MSAWSLYASAGQIGFTVNGGTTTKLDNFGGGTYTGLLSPQPDGAFRTVAYSSPRASEANTPAIVVTPPANQTWRKYYYLGGKRIALRRRYGSGVSNVVNYWHADHLGSASAMWNATMSGFLRYQPFGGARWTSGALRTDYLWQKQEASTTGRFRTDGINIFVLLFFHVIIACRSRGKRQSSVISKYSCC